MMDDEIEDLSKRLKGSGFIIHKAEWEMQGVTIVLYKRT